MFGIRAVRGGAMSVYLHTASKMMCISNHCRRRSECSKWGRLLCLKGFRRFAEMALNKEEWDDGKVKRQLASDQRGG